MARSPDRDRRDSGESSSDEDSVVTEESPGAGGPTGILFSLIFSILPLRSKKQPHPVNYASSRLSNSLNSVAALFAFKGNGTGSATPLSNTCCIRPIVIINAN